VAARTPLWLRRGGWLPLAESFSWFRASHETEAGTEAATPAVMMLRNTPLLALLCLVRCSAPDLVSESSGRSEQGLTTVTPFGATQFPSSTFNLVRVDGTTSSGAQVTCTGALLSNSALQGAVVLTAGDCARLPAERLRVRMRTSAAAEEKSVGSVRATRWSGNFALLLTSTFSSVSTQPRRSLSQTTLAVGQSLTCAGVGGTTNNDSVAFGELIVTAVYGPGNAELTPVVSADRRTVTTAADAGAICRLTSQVNAGFDIVDAVLSWGTSSNGRATAVSAGELRAFTELPDNVPDLFARPALRLVQASASGCLTAYEDARGLATKMACSPNDTFQDVFILDDTITLGTRRVTGQRIFSAATGKVLGTNSNGLVSWSRLVPGTPGQMYALATSGNTPVVSVSAPGRCLDVPGANPGWTYLQVFPCHGGENQMFRVERCPVNLPGRQCTTLF
jgi:hypothetical protein